MTNKVKDNYNQIVYLLQGGGALGAYQVGICEALFEHGYDPTWVIGTSIGGINGALIAGNKPKDRTQRMKEFWSNLAVYVPDYFPGLMNDQMRSMQNAVISECAAMFGVEGFFTPRAINPWLEIDETPDKLSYYDTTALKTNLEQLIDFDLLNSQQVRLTVSAICINTGNVARFDNTKEKITIDHIMATAALPPGFPAVKIADKYYWDGGLNSNTPFEVLLEEPINDDLLCFVVNLFSNVEHLPINMAGILKRKKDLEYISQHHALVHYFCEMHRYRTQLKNLCMIVPGSDQSSDMKTVCEAQHPSSLNIARFHYRDKPYDSWSKDFEFSQQSLKERFLLGYADVKKAFQDSSWLELVPEAIQLHNF